MFYPEYSHKSDRIPSAANPHPIRCQSASHPLPIRDHIHYPIRDRTSNLQRFSDY
ncbi:MULTISPECIES: hypothetical protein [Planktothricoides]|uniref:Uncharacterized protein n=2 Tax=Planktothricoides raciborskii TaxID=132608 RepID=A0AAU8JP22_9CYAN|nr:MULTISPECIES: hypothetical protein [Planktothricoides]MBD2543523.1 hypothetical protein [Planktothricoides raciborskii FACHB-1370]MBD2581214.1 hypothetical protein [Planktothricoides raciborskii FACHB-1261]